METNPKHTGGSDLPRPRGKQSGSDLPPISRRKAAQGRPQQNPNTNSRKPKRSYGSDTMQLRTAQGKYDTEFEQQRRAAVPPRSNGNGRRQQHTPPPPPPKPKKKHKSFLGRFVRGVVTFAAVIFLIYSAAALLLISRIEKLPREGRTVTSGALDDSYVTSILLIGTDARDASIENGRSDSMILVSLNSRTQTIYLTSFLRDAYVEIPGHGHAKLNAAYSYGGAELLMDTLEQNYQVSIDDYMSVSFSGFAGVIDAFGGVEITLSDSEAQAVNDILLSEVNELMGDARDADFLSGGGTYVLNGKQALSYARIRYVGNADFERTSRQREVMTQLFGNIKTNLVSAVPKLASSALPHVSTNMSTGSMYFLSLRAPFAAGYEIEQLQIPAEGTWSGQNVDGQSVLVVDFEENTALLQETVYASTKGTG